MEKKKTRILILKSPPEKTEEDPYVRELKENGYEALLIPTLKFTYKNLEKLSLHLNDPESFDGIIFSSQRCVEAASRALKGRPLNLKWKKMRIYAVGEKTGQIALEKLGLTCQGMSSGNMSNLVAAMKAQKSFEKPVLLIGGNLQGDTTMLELEESGFCKVKKMECYNTEESDSLKIDILRAFDFDARYCLLFFSPSGVRAAFSHLPQSAKTELLFIALGPTTAVALEEMGTSVAGICEHPTPHHVLSCIKKLL